MDITKVIHVYDVQSSIFGAIGFLFLCACGILALLALIHLFSGLFLEALARIAIAAVCFFAVLGCGKLIHDPTIRYEAVVYDMVAVEKQYYIISAKDDGVYIVEPKQDGGAE